MDQTERRALDKLCEIMSRDLDLEQLQPALISKGLVESDPMLFRGSDNRNVIKLINIVKNAQVSDSFRLFCECVRANWPWVADELEQELERIKQNPGPVDPRVRIPPPVSYFTNRTEVDNLLTWIRNSQSPYKVLQGLHGIGKTQIVRAAAARFIQGNADAAEVPPGVRMEINSISITALIESLELLAKHIYIHVEEISDPKEKARRLLQAIIMELNRKNDRYTLLYFDNVSTKVQKTLTKDIFRECKFKVIFSCNDANWYADVQERIEGFTDSEVNQLVQIMGITADDGDIKTLAKLMGYHPLGIVVSLHTMKQQKKTLDIFLDDLGETIPKGDTNEENEYPQGLQAMLEIALNALNAEVGPVVYEHVQSFGFLSGVDIPLDELGVLLKCDKDKRVQNIDSLVDAISTLGLGDIKPDESGACGRLLSIHVLVQKALRSQLSEQDKTKEKVNKILHDVCSIFNADNRFQKQFNALFKLLPHVESILYNADKYEVSHANANIAKILLNRNVGHMYTQINQPLKCEGYLNTAIKTSLSLIGIVSSKELLETNAIDIHRRLSMLQEQCNLMPLVLQKCYDNDDLKLWSSQGLEGIQTITGSMKKAEMTEKLYRKLVRLSCALPEETVKKVYVTELFASLLYTYSRIYFYRKTQGLQIGDDEKTMYHDAMKLSEELCKVLHEKYGVRVIHLMLTQRYGLLYFLLDGDNIPDVYKAIEEYQELLKDESNYFEMGLLKKTKDDDYHKLVCVRQIVKGYGILLNLCIHGEERAIYMSQAKSFLDNLKVQDIAKLKMFSECAFQNEKADLLVQIGDRESVEEALNMYQQSCNKEKDSGFVRYPWYNAIEGLINLLRQKQVEKHVVEGRFQELKTAVGQSGQNVNCTRLENELSKL